MLNDKPIQDGRLAELDLLAKEASILDASESSNTRRALEGAVRHFTMVYGGLLPCTGEQLKDYLVRYAGELSIATLEQRRVLIGRWHRENGFTDNPNDHEVVRRVMRGIRRKFGKKQKQAKPAPLRVIEKIVSHLDAASTAIAYPDERQNRAAHLQASRDKAMILTSFWFGLRSDELISLRVCDVSFHLDAEVPYLELYLIKSKTDREGQGSTRKLEALPGLCPMTAIREWLDVCSHGVQPMDRRRDENPLFVKVSRWGSLSDSPIHRNSINKLLKSLFEEAGIDPEDYSSHSMRRGIANWIIDSGASITELTEWIGWRDTRTAMRYLDGKSSLPSKIIERHLGHRRSLVEKEDDSK